VRRQPKEAATLLGPVLEKGETIEKQAAIAALASAATPEADHLLADYTALLADGKIAPELRLDLVEAASARLKAGSKSSEMQKHLDAHMAARNSKDPLAPYVDSLEGGDPETGRRLFLYKAEVSCQRCHKVDGVGGVVGPDLNGIGSKQKRDYLLESIVLPSAKIAKGYESVVLLLKNGKSETGILKAENADTIQLMNAEGQLKTIAKDRVEERLVGKSPMPEDIVKHLSARELRDLVAFLAELKEKPKTP
jgi:quinoprotein glucose dehydrogenase